MPMVSKSAPRRLYVRSAYGLVLCFDGGYFGPKAGETTPLTSDDKVTVEVLAKAGGKSRVRITQVVAEGAAPVVETWTKKELVFEKRAPKQVA